MVVNMAYYGISMGAANLSDDVFLSFLLVSLIEIPSYLLCVLTMDRAGRKPLFVGSMLVLGVFLTAAGYIPEGDFQTVFSLIGKFGAAASFCAVYLYAAELYPSEIRGTALGMCSMFGRIGGIAAPQITIYLPSILFDAFPMLFIGIW